jgi:hypothetical protein
MTFADKCKMLGVHRGRRMALVAADNQLRAALLPRAGQRGGREADHTIVLMPRKS